MLRKLFAGLLFITLLLCFTACDETDVTPPLSQVASTVSNPVPAQPATPATTGLAVTPLTTQPRSTEAVTEPEAEPEDEIPDVSSEVYDAVDTTLLTSYDGPPGTWAIYWYLCGTDLETYDGCATDDLIEMLEVELPENVTVVIATGGAEMWQNSVIEADVLERYTYIGDTLTFIGDLPLASMADPRTLIDFLDFCNTNYPAEKQALIIWDHGGGSIGGMLSDEFFPDDVLTLPQFKQVLEAVPLVSGKFEFVGIDACLMATIDMVGVLADHARYLIASEEIEPGCGWDYEGLFRALAADTTIDGRQLGIAICDSYYNTCAALGYEKTITLSVIDLAKAGPLLAAYDAVGEEALLRAMSERQAFISAYGRAAYAAEYYGKGLNDMVDLGDLIRKAGDLLPSNGRVLLSALNDAVAYQVKGEYRSNASGLACYHLYSGSRESLETFYTLETSLPFRYFYEYSATRRLSDSGQAYVQYLSSMSSEVSSSLAGGIETLPETESLGYADFPVYIGEDQRWHLDLGPELADNLAAVFVNLSWVEPVSGMQVLWGTNTDLISDWENGLFIEDFSDLWGSIDNAQVYMELISIENGRILYSCPIELDEEVYDLHVGFSKGEYEILSAVKRSHSLIASKNQRILQPGEIIYPIHYVVPMLETGPGEIVEIPMGQAVISETTSFYARPLGNGYFKLTFQMVDFSGNSWHSAECSFRVRNGEITRLPGGVNPMAAETPEGFVEILNIREDSWFNSSWNQNIPYTYASVSPQLYRSLADILELTSPRDSNTGTYTIQITSDTIDLSQYLGTELAYVSGYIYAKESVFERRDIILVIEELIEVW
ncbi:MAG: clostripain-related cysteine peptidase [Symbiobacteriaceae bacterium]|nr:clostripain-related cysteine peptidase [Symbiobacteriaceae bacterium]